MIQTIVQIIPISGVDPARCESFIGAARLGSVDMVAHMIQEGADLNENLDGWTALHEAARGGHLEVVDLLLANGAESKTAHNGRLLPILVAAQHGHVNIVRRFAENGDASHASLSNAMIFAAYNGHLDTVEYLLSLDANLANSRNDDGFTPTELSMDSKRMHIKSTFESLSPFALTMAVTSGHRNVVFALVRSGARVDAYALGAACRLGHSYIKFLLDHGAEFNDETISYAVQGRRVDIVEMLLQHGISIGISNALRYSGSDLKITTLLLEHGADPNTIVGDNGGTALAVAISNGRAHIARPLLDHGAVMTPGLLDLALVLGNLAIVEALTEAGYVKNSIIPTSVNVLLHYHLLLAGAVNTGAADSAFQALMAPIIAIRTQVCEGVGCMIALAFEAQGVDFSSSGWSEEKCGLVSSIIDELVFIGCTHLNFFYSVTPFLATADEDMLKHAQIALKYLRGAFPGTGTDRARISAIFNEMIERSNHIGFRPVVKALYGIYHEDMQIRKSFKSWGFATGDDPKKVQELPEGVVDLVLSVEHGPFNPGFKDRAMRQLIKSIRRLQSSIGVGKPIL